MKALSAKVSIGLICLLLGMMLSIQVRSVIKINDANKKRISQMDDLATTLGSEQKRNQDLSDRLRKAENDLIKYEKAGSNTNSRIKLLNKQLDMEMKMSGSVDVKGEGVVVTVDDSKSDDPNSDTRDLITHDSDLLFVVNDLRDSGAECISINDERLVATSEIRCAGTVINVNDVRIGPPYVIKAIGNPDMLDAGLRIKGGTYNYLIGRQLQVNIVKHNSNDIFIPKYKGAYNFKYATPVVKGR